MIGDAIFSVQAAQAPRFLNCAAKSPANPDPNNSAAPGNGAAVNWAVPFKVNWTLRLLGSPGSPVRPCDQVKPVKAFVRLLNEPVAFPPMFVFKPPTGIRPPVSLADSDVRSAVIVEPLVLLLGKGFGPPVNKEKVWRPSRGTLIEIGAMMSGRG